MANVGLQEEADERIPGIPHLLARRCPWAVRKHLRNIFRMRHLWTGKGSRLQWRMAGRGCRRSPSANGPGAARSLETFGICFSM